MENRKEEAIRRMEKAFKGSLDSTGWLKAGS